MSTMTMIKPSELHLDSVPIRKIGELLINSEQGILYMVIPDSNDPTKKVARPIQGASAFKLANYIKNGQLIAPNTDTLEDVTNVWYDTTMAYVEPSINKQDAYISVKRDTDNGQTEWVKILPITEAKNIILGDSGNSNKPYTLADLIVESGKRLKYNPARTRFELIASNRTEKELWDTTNLEGLNKDVQKGELYLKTTPTGEEELRLKTSNNADGVLIANTLNETLRDYVRDITISNNRPVNIGRHSIWMSYNNNTVTENVLNDDLKVLYMHTAKDNFYENGLKWVEPNIASSSLRLYDNNKGIHYRHLNSENINKLFNVNYKLSNTDAVFTYFEITVINDATKLIKFIVTPENISNLDSPEVLTMRTSGLIKKPNYDNGAATSEEIDRTDIVPDSETVTYFFQVYKPADSMNGEIAFGYVNNGTLHYIIGDDNSQDRENWILVKNIDKFSIAIDHPISSSDFPLEGVSAHIGKIRGINGRPEAATVINSELPNDKAWEPSVLATSAKAVFLDGHKRLSEIFDGGKLVTTLRNYTALNNGQNIKQGEIVAQELTNGGRVSGVNFYYGTSDGNAVLVSGKYEAAIKAHFEESVKILENDTNYLTDVESDSIDRSRVLYSDKFKEYNTNNRILTLNPTIPVPKLENGVMKYYYRMLMPKTLTENVLFAVDTPQGKEFKTLATYINETDTHLSELDRKSIVYNTMADIEGLNILPTDTTSYLDVFSKILDTMVDNSIYINSIVNDQGDMKLETVSLVDINSNYINGNVEMYRGKDSAYITISNKAGDIYRLNYKKSDLGVFTLVTKDGNITPFTNVSTRFVDRTFKTTDQVDNMIARDTLTTSKMSAINSNTGDLTIDATKFQSNTGTAIKWLDKNINNGTVFPLIQVTGSSTIGGANNTKTTVGSQVVKTLQLESNEGLTWREGKTNTVHKLLTEKDLSRYFTNRGDLLSGANNTINLNSLVSSNHAGYYLYKHVAGNNLDNSFPKTNMDEGDMVLIVMTNDGSGVANNNKIVTQTLYHYTQDGVQGSPEYGDVDIYMRTLIPGTNNFTPWRKTATQKEVDSKLSANGGTIEGNLVVDDNYKIIAKEASISGHVGSDVYKSKEGSDLIKYVPAADTMILGGQSDTAPKVINMQVEPNQGSSNTNGVFINNKRVLTVDDIRGLQAANSTYGNDIEDLKTKVANAVSLTTYENDKENFVVKNKLNDLTGSLNFITKQSRNNVSNILINPTTVSIKDATLKIPSKVLTVDNNDENYTHNASTNLFNSSTRYDVYSSDVLVDNKSIFTVSVNNDTVNNIRPNVPTSMQIISSRLDNNKSEYSIRNIYGRTTYSNEAKIYTSEDVINDINDLDNSVNTKSVKMLSNKLMKNIYDRISGINKVLPSNLSSSHIVNLGKLKVGQYEVTTDKLVNFGLNNIFTTDVIMYVLENEKLIVAYNEKGMAICKNINNNYTWIPVMSSAEYYDKTTVDNKINELTKELREFTRSMDYAGNDPDAVNKIGKNKLALSYIIPEANARKALQFKSNALPTGFTSGSIIVTIKGVTVYGEYVDSTIAFVKSPLYSDIKSTWKENSPSSQITVVDYTIENDTINFKLVDKTAANFDTTGGAFNVFVQFFGEELATHEVNFNVTGVELSSLNI